MARIQHALRSSLNYYHAPNMKMANYKKIQKNSIQFLKKPQFAQNSYKQKNFKTIYTMKSGDTKAINRIPSQPNFTDNFVRVSLATCTTIQLLAASQLLLPGNPIDGSVHLDFVFPILHNF